MATPHKLSSNEVAALVGGLMDMDKDVGGGSDGARPYKLGKNDMSIMGDLHALRMINERFCRIARSVFLPMIRVAPRISAFPPEIKKFSDYSDELENFVSLTISRMSGLRGSQLLMVPPAFVSLLTEAYYGGAVRYVPNRRNEFTATEQRVIELVTNGLNRALEMAWRDLMPLQFELLNREENLQFASFVESGEMIVNCSFMVQLPDTDPAQFDVIYPLQAFRPIAAQLRSRMQSELVDEDASWRARLVEAIMNVPLTMSARLAEPEVALGHLIGATRGSVIPVNLSPDPKVLIEEQPFFDVEVGERGGRAAVSMGARYTL
ncbi:flagellar motor switch protein FliM [Meridianimarinicoccus roseus]|jgi:flagellar motor switch protein FliM|uniref:Flagellar motor switch protein FliM n=1 Tax=Meridianimarinicoccus roseus TaxID=2072018 RepID=A0A2V2LGH3_9RHOB|nr:flagellar motor switch protein FliM [Meridianimarinicoccus roseus]PWR02604.1 flagellar motor switch protein FliM [Meridianimarinicoccus roseus]